MKTYLGIDVGSISTKLVLINEENQVLFSLYLRTEGNPIGAVQRGLKELRKYIENHNPAIEIAGVGTTGSARYLAGVITGADLIKNEISAHAKGASFFIPDARTVIEIGGQDSKIIILENRVVVDFAMNLICVKGNTKITTNPNYTSKSIKEVKIGQKVLTHEGRFKPVEQVFERKYQGEMIKIEAADLSEIEITPNHKILGIKKNNNANKPEFIAAKDFREDDLIVSFQKKNRKRILIPIKKNKKYNFDGAVYNLKVKDDESYVANSFVVKNCAAGTGSFLDAQAFRMGVPIEKFGEIALESKTPTIIGSRCLTKDNYLLTTEGVKSIKDIQEGDFVLSENQFKRVTKKYERIYSGVINKITRRYSADSPLIITSGHPVLVIKTQLCPYKKFKDKKSKYICREDCDRKHIRPRCKLNFYEKYSPQWVKVEELKPCDLIITPKHNTPPKGREYSLIPLKKFYFSSEKRKNFQVSRILKNFNLNLIRLSGYYLAEGCAFSSNKGEYEVQFALNEAEKKYIEDIQNLMSSIFKTTRGGIYQNFYTGNGIQLKFGSKAAYNFLKQFGQGAPNKRIPHWVFDLPKDYLIELIKGVWRGDGSFSCIDHLTFYTSSQSLWEGLYVILEKCGYISSKKKYFEESIGRVTSQIKGRLNPIIRQHPLYKLELGGRQMEQLYKDLEIEPSEEIQGFLKNRKRTYQIAYNKENYILYPIRKIEKEFVRNIKVYNLEVEDTHSYLVNGFLCHNCTVFCESDMIHKQQIGHSREDIIAGLCYGLARNFLANVGKGKKIQPPIVFLGGVSENMGMRKAFEDILGEKIIVPEYNTVMGAFGVALLVQKLALQKTKFRGFEISEQNIKCTSFQCKSCPNLCEVIEARIEGKVVSRWNDRCGKFSNLKYE